MDIQDFIEDFNNGGTDAKNYFNDYETFFKILEKRGLMNKLDVSGPNIGDIQNDLLRYYYNNDKPTFYRSLNNILGDVEIIDGVAYLVLSSPGELSILFCNHRNDISRDTIESILDGEHDDYYYNSDLTDDVYRDVIEELTKENILYLKEYIIKTLDGKEIDPETNELELIASEQGHPEYVVVNKENIDRIFDDKETMNELLSGYLGELKSELYNIYSNAYNSAYSDMVYNDIWSELDGIVIPHGEYISIPHPYKENTQVQKFKIKIWNFDDAILEMISPSSNYSLEYYGSFLGSYADENSCLSPRIDDYPDSRKIDANINEFFRDYI
jgi:hypothetical protein